MPPQRIGDAVVEKVYEIDGLTMPFLHLFANVDDEDIQRAQPWVPDPHLNGSVAESRCNFSWHTYVIKAHDEVILVDTGHGNDKQRPDFIPSDVIDTDFLSRLNSIGVERENVTMVLCTHMHYDHVGWNTIQRQGRWVPTFPNARYLFPRKDYEWQLEETKTLPNPAFDESVVPVASAGQLDLVDPGDVIYDSEGIKLWIEDGAGHTPGSIIIRLESKGETASFVGDVIHHPVQVFRPDMRMPFEPLLQMSIDARTKMLAEVADTGTIIFPAHFNFTSGGRVFTDADNGGYRWEFVPED
ncbi:hypothetical protein AZG88_25125 [Rhodococcus sp. LB1]|nr:hypothetical protein AZG88_25125 [Rhodococcus sp. LB1]